MTSLCLRIVLFTGAWLTSATAINGEEKEMLRGFPALISCGGAKDMWPADEPNDNQTAQCVIAKNERVLFNESIRWDDRLMKGYFFDVTDDWHHTTITITLCFDYGDHLAPATRPCTTKNRTVSRGFIMLVKEAKLNIHPQYYRVVVGTDTAFRCRVPSEMTAFLSKDQFKSINTVWRKDGEDIRRDHPQYEYLPGEYGNHLFEGLNIRNATFQKTPGSYECVLEYNKEKLTTEINNLCVLPENRYTTPSIKPKQYEYIVAPGSDVMLYCYGMGTGNTMNRMLWKRYKKTLCMAVRRRNKDCSIDFSTAVKFCQPASEEDLREAREANRGNFTSVFTLRNVTYGNAGIYECELANTGDHVTAEFRIVVKEPETRHNHLEIATGVVGACFVLCIVFVMVYYWKRLEIRYLRKKFDSFKETNRPVTYLVYANDVFRHEMNENPLKDVREWMKSQGYKYHDPNDGISCSNVGEHVVEHSLKLVEKCLSMTVILTPDLLEENTLEIFKIYTGFEDNVKRNFPLVFVCSKEMEKKIYLKPDLKFRDLDHNKNMDLFVTFRRFMKKSTVIRWKPGVSTKFHRALYVALPKARPPCHYENEQVTCVFEGESA